MLWAVVFFRFIIPFTIQMPVGAVPVAPQPIPQSIISSETPSIQGGVAVVDNIYYSAIDETVIPVGNASEVTTIQRALGVGSIIWFAGFIALLLYTVISYLRLKKKVNTAILVNDNIYETDLIKTPFVLGFIHPKIYVPVGLDAQESKYIIQHEQIHIKRRDNLIKPLAFIVTAVHWFNPLAWMAYMLMARDMELSADEHVMKQSDTDIRNAYSNSLLTLSVKKNGLLNHLAFGETGVSARIKNVLKYKKSTFWISSVAVVIVVATSVLLLGSTSGSTSNAELGDVAFNHTDSDYTLMVYIDDSYSVNDAMAMRDQIEAIPNVTSAVFVSRQQAMDGFMSRHEDEPRFDEIDATWFRNRYTVYIRDTALKEQTISDLQSVKGVYRITANLMMYDFNGDSNASDEQRRTIESNLNYYVVGAAMVEDEIVSTHTDELTIQEGLDDIESLLNNLETFVELHEFIDAAANKIQDRINAVTSEIVSGSGQFVWPVPGNELVTSLFGSRMHPVYRIMVEHTGIDISARLGVIVVAADNGTVIFSEFNPVYGNYIVICHGEINGQRVTTLYAHLSTLYVNEGDVIERGQLIGYIGMTGITTGPHLHFEVSVGGVRADPLDHL